MLEEGRGGFMDSSRYREVMTGLFFRGEAPDPEPESRSPGDKGPKRSRPPTRSKLEELRGFNAQIATLNKPKE